MSRKRISRGGSALVLVAIFAIGFGSFGVAAPETDQGAGSWPHGVMIPGTPVTAFARLTDIHNLAITTLPTASEALRPAIVRVLQASFACAAFDGAAAVPEPPPATLPAHAPGHAGAAAKVQAAWQDLHRPPDQAHPSEWADWAKCAEDLEHGHD